jgi:predicted Zn finger-like uncharacterized protein
LSEKSSIIVFCEDCGKRYQIDPKKIKGKEAKFKCKSCNHIIEVKKPEKKNSEQTVKQSLTQGKTVVSDEKSSGESETNLIVQTFKAAQPKKIKSKSLKLKAKMAIFFLIIPTLLISIAGAISIWQFNTLSASLTVSTHSSENPGHTIDRAKDKFVGVWAVAVLLAAGVISIYGYRLAKKIETLSEMAERISLGDLSAEVTVQSNDEIETIGDAVTRLQDSVYLALERLQKRRS